MNLSLFVNALQSFASIAAPIAVTALWQGIIVGKRARDLREVCTSYLWGASLPYLGGWLCRACGASLFASVLGGGTGRSDFGRSGQRGGDVCQTLAVS